MYAVFNVDLINLIKVGFVSSINVQSRIFFAPNTGGPIKIGALISLIEFCFLQYRTFYYSVIMKNVGWYGTQTRSLKVKELISPARISSFPASPR
jgi:hypothetical protein